MVAIPGLRAAACGAAQVVSEEMHRPTQGWLTYLAVYACGFGGGSSLRPFRELRYCIEDTAFVARLAAAIPERLLLEGWQVQAADERWVWVKQGPIEAFVEKQRIHGQPLDVGCMVGIPAAVIAPGQSPGFVVRQGGFVPSSDTICRFYLNIGSRDAEWALGTLARALEADRVPYQLKVLAHPRSYVRRDSCVLYVAEAEATTALGVVRTSAAASSVVFEAGVPLLTFELDRGIGYAEQSGHEPEPAWSYGLWLAEALVSAAREASSPDAIERAVLARSAESGRNLDHPALLPKSVASSLLSTRSMFDA